MITVPAGTKIWSEYDDRYGHFRRYDLEMSSDILDAAGFSTETNSYFFHGLYFAARLMRKLSNNRTVIVKAPTGARKIFHKIVSLFLVLDYWLIPGSVIGSSIISVGKKRK